MTQASLSQTISGSLLSVTLITSVFSMLFIRLFRWNCLLKPSPTSLYSLLCHQLTEYCWYWCPRCELLPYLATHPYLLEIRPETQPYLKSLRKSVHPLLSSSIFMTVCCPKFNFTSTHKSVASTLILTSLLMYSSWSTLSNDFSNLT